MLRFHPSLLIRGILSFFDLILRASGDVVPADALIVSSDEGIEVDQSSLTGSAGFAFFFVGFRTQLLCFVLVLQANLFQYPSSWLTIYFPPPLFEV